MKPIPYDLIPIFAVIVLTARHAARSSAPVRSRRRVTAAALMAILITPFFPLAAVLAQVGVGVYILIYQMAVEERGECPP